jgi:hypothetical protein
MFSLAWRPGLSPLFLYDRDIRLKAGSTALSEDGKEGMQILLQTTQEGQCAQPQH